MPTGTVTKYIAPKGYGFVTSDADGKDYFFHVADMNFEQPAPKNGDRLGFTLVPNRSKSKRAELMAALLHHV